MEALLKMVGNNDTEEKIKNLKVGDIVFSFTSEIYNKYTPFLDYSFHKITGETKSYWKIGGYDMIRKTDLHIRGEDNYKKMHIMGEHEWKMKKQVEEYRKV